MPIGTLASPVQDQAWTTLAQIASLKILNLSSKNSPKRIGKALTVATQMLLNMKFSCASLMLEYSVDAQARGHIWLEAP